jgi:hypothetical protein
MAKKRKASRSSASRGAKKKTAGKKKAPKAPKVTRAAVKRPAAAYRSGLENPREVDFRPLKNQITAHIARLSGAKSQSPAIENAIRSLRQVQAELNGECSPTMILPIP